MSSREDTERTLRAAYAARQRGDLEMEDARIGSFFEFYDPALAARMMKR
jgi:hypothetical protein